MPVSKCDLKVDWATYKAAKYACEHWHYSGKMPVNKTARLGVWENDKYIGCVVFSCGSAGVGNIAKTFGLKSCCVAELSRVALTHHKSYVTRIIKLTLRLLRRSQNNLRLVVSYADPEQKHEGKIYQAGNWMYVGRSAKDKAYIDRNGRRWHSRSVSNTGFKIHCGIKTRCPKPSDMQEVIVEPKYKYLMPLDSEMRKRILPLSKPYPKRAGGDTTDTPADQAGEGGSTPTPALHPEIK
jgi:hypothetical protein